MSRWRRGTTAAGSVLVGAVMALSGCTAGAPTTLPTTLRATPPATPPATLPGTSASTALAELTVRKNLPATGYARSRFGDGWLDPDGNGCDSREDVLRRDLTSVVLRGAPGPSPSDPAGGSQSCRVVDRGTLRDPYTGVTVAFVRGPSTSGLVQIDHVVSLSNAWRTNAQSWSADARARFANDPLNLLATTEASNMDKADGDAAQWLPPLPAARCAFAARQVAVKAKYGLTVRQAEHDALAAVLATCPDQPLPS